MPRECTNDDIRRLQDNLSVIRNAGGWSSESFGDMIGVTKQTISNLENHNIAMSKTQYIAIRAVLDYEIKQRKHDKDDYLSSVVNLCLNSEDISEEKMSNARAYLQGASKSKISKKVMLTALAALVGTIVVKSSGDWLGSIINRENK